MYNLRVADWHTYFVGEKSWGWAAWAHNACIVEQAVTGSDTEAMRLATLAYQYRQAQAANAAPTERARWAAGEKDIAIAVTSGAPSERYYVSRGSKHAEEWLIDGVSAAGFPSSSNRVISLFTERSPCDTSPHNCLSKLKLWLARQTGAKVVVYYIIPYVANQPGSVLLDGYRALGIGT